MQIALKERDPQLLRTCEALAVVETCRMGL